MRRTSSVRTGKLDFGEVPERLRMGLRLVAAGEPRGPEKYRMFELKRRRAQIRARRALGVS